MAYFSSTQIAATGLTAQRLRMDVISENIANVNTTRTEKGTPYKRKTVIFEQQSGATRFDNFLNQEVEKAAQGKGVRVKEIVEDESPGATVYDPQHPDADESGYVKMPNVNIIEEMVNMIAASRSYEANITSMNTAKAIIAKTLEISR